MTAPTQDPMSLAQRLQPAPRVFSTAFGLLMVAASAVRADGLILLAAALAVLAVLVGLHIRAAATLAVLLTMPVVILSDPPPMFVAVSGLSAAVYLVLRHAVDGPVGVVTTTRPTVIAVVGFAALGVFVTSVPWPWPWPWLPLLAPPAVVVVYLLAAHPFVGDHSRPDRTDFEKN